MHLCWLEPIELLGNNSPEEVVIWYVVSFRQKSTKRPGGQSKTTATRRKKRDTRRRLPYDYTPWRAFAKLHGIPESAVLKAIKEQHVYVERGDWIYGGRTVKEAFDYYECELFYNHFHTHPRFEPCDDCPHK